LPETPSFVVVPKKRRANGLPGQRKNPPPLGNRGSGASNHPALAGAPGSKQTGPRRVAVDPINHCPRKHQAPAVYILVAFHGAKVAPLPSWRNDRHPALEYSPTDGKFIYDWSLITDH
jgi:hypothetical protein